MSAFLKDEFEQAVFEVNEIIDNVLEVKDFISEEELSEIFKVVDVLTEDDWKKEYISNLKNFCLDKFGRDDVDNLVAEGKFEITLGWDDKIYNLKDNAVQKRLYERLNSLVQKNSSELSVTGMVSVQRMQPETKLTAHTDQHTDPSIRYAAILYLNDDYADGELFFVNKDLQLKPKTGTLIVFPGTDEFEHGVKPVGTGPIRYVLVSFIKVTDFYENNKY